MRFAQQGCAAKPRLGEWRAVRAAGRAHRLLNRATTMRPLALGLLLGLVLTPAAAPAARLCGDDVAGRAVPCACGDTLVASRTLGPDDPITQAVCPGTGLVVHVAPDRAAARLDLAGTTIAGSGRGPGILVLSGGADGLTIAGPGEVRGFDVGILAHGGGLARATDVLATGNVSDGVALGGVGYTLVNCEAARNGRDGFALRGSGFVLDGNRALHNGRHGFALSGDGARLGAVTGNEAAANGRDGIVVRGRAHEVAHPVATGNVRHGLRTRIAGGRIADARAVGNGGDGVAGSGNDLVVSGTDARDNGRSGVDVRGASVRDGGGNRGHADRRSRRRSGCRVGTPCR
jgi:hypothetical protein